MPRRTAYYDAPPTQPRLRTELIIGSALLAVGLFIVPAGVYFVGQVLLGPYADAAGNSNGIGTFYGDFFGDLATLSGRAWALAIGPLLLVSALRALFLRRRGDAESERERNDPPPRTPPRAKPRAEASGRRVEPRIS